MNSLKGKVTTFVKDHKTEIIVGGLAISAIAYKVHIDSIRREAFMRGAHAGFHATIDWFDKNFENVKLRELWEGWAAANPDKVRYF